MHSYKPVLISQSLLAKCENICIFLKYRAKPIKSLPIILILRINKNNQLINHLNADIVCLQEVPDIKDAAHITSSLIKSDYSDFIEVPGIKAIGPSSMMYVASKYKIDPRSVEFTPFVKEDLGRTVFIWFQCIGSHLIYHLGSVLKNPKAAWEKIQDAVQKNLPRIELTGRAASSEKGFLSFTLENSKVTVICTHLQHSETPAVPTGDDKLSRRFQMFKIAEKIKSERGKGNIVIFTGDLNQEESELNITLQGENFKHLQLQRDEKVQKQHTWGGDGWCAPLRNEPISAPLVLDYTFAVGAKSITTKIHDVGFKGDKFQLDVLSDHKPLLSRVSL